MLLQETPTGSFMVTINASYKHFLQFLLGYVAFAAIVMMLIPKGFPVSSTTLILGLFFVGLQVLPTRFLYPYIGIAYVVGLVDWYFFHDVGIFTATSEFVFLLLQVMLGLRFVQRILHHKSLLINDVGYLYGMVILLPAFVMAFAMALIDWIQHGASFKMLSLHYSHFVARPFIGGLSIAVILPIAFSIKIPKNFQLSQDLVIKAIAAMITLVGTYYVFSQKNPAGYELAPLSFLVLPVIVWCAFRFGFRFNALLMGAVSIFTVLTDFHYNDSLIQSELSLLTTSTYLLICQFLFLTVASQRTEIRLQFDAIEVNTEKLKLGETVFNESRNTIIVFDDNWVTHAVNKNWENQTGYSKKEAVGKKSDFISSGAHSESFYEDLWSQLRKKGYWDGEYCHKRKDGSVYYEFKTITALDHAAKEGRLYVSMGIDITNQKFLTEELDFRNTHDATTALYNRLGFAQEFANKQTHVDGCVCAFFLMDLDNFKYINDVYGHDFGDKVVLNVALKIQQIVSKSAIVGRFGPDEIGVFDIFDSEEAAVKMGNAFLQSYSAPTLVGENLVDIRLSIGIAFNENSDTMLEDLISKGYDAQRVAKANGKHTYSVFQELTAADSARILWLQNGLHDAIANNQLRLEYQPKKSLTLGHTVGYEALLRWDHPECGVISPGEFIPVAEKNGLIRSIDYWVFEAACRQMSAWQSQGLYLYKVSINIAFQPSFHRDLSTV